MHKPDYNTTIDRFPCVYSCFYWYTLLVVIFVASWLTQWIALILHIIYFSQAMRQQGYVSASHGTSCSSEEEVLIGGTMSVWQTVLHAALMRLPESFGTENIIKRCSLCVVYYALTRIKSLYCCLDLFPTNIVHHSILTFLTYVFSRAMEVLQLVELHSARDVSTAVHSRSMSVLYRTFSREPALTVYERQCLRLALQLLNAPQVIFLDEVRPAILLSLQVSLWLVILLSRCSNSFSSQRRTSTAKKLPCS